MSGEHGPFIWTSGAATDRGRVRQVNQDAFLDRPDLGLWAVADGMGGHSAGGMASQLLVERLGSLGPARLLGVAVEATSAVLADVNHRLVARAAAMGEAVIGSTIVVLIAVGDHCAILWAGDSRAYRLRHGELVQLTLDHTQVQEMVEQGRLTREQADLHPLGNILVRAVGGDVELEVDRRIEALGDRDRYLLCSDGLMKELAAEEMTPILGQTRTAAETAGVLVRRACEAGGHDNVTALVIDFAQHERN